MIFINMSRKPINPKDRRTKFSITINPVLFDKIDELHSNKSKYVERLIFLDLITNKHIDNIDL